jgi:hypothetical protein
VIVGSVFISESILVIEDCIAAMIAESNPATFWWRDVSMLRGVSERSSKVIFSTRTSTILPHEFVISLLLSIRHTSKLSPVNAIVRSRIAINVKLIIPAVNNSCRSIILKVAKNFSEAEGRRQNSGDN